MRIAENAAQEQVGSGQFRADLLPADMVWADMVWADMVWADMVWADLVWAYLLLRCVLGDLHLTGPPPWDARPARLPACLLSARLPPAGQRDRGSRRGDDREHDERGPRLLCPRVPVMSRISMIAGLITLGT